MLNRIGLAHTFQNIWLFFNLSVEDNICIVPHSGRTKNPIDALFCLKQFRIDEQRMSAQIMELFALFKMKKKRSAYPQPTLRRTP